MYCLRWLRHCCPHSRPAALFASMQPKRAQVQGLVGWMLASSFFFPLSKNLIFSGIYAGSKQPQRLMCFRLPFPIPHRFFYISMRSFENVNNLTIYIKSIRIKGLVRNPLHGNRHLKHLCEHIPFPLYRAALCLQIFPNYFARIIMACKMPRILR